MTAQSQLFDALTPTPDISATLQRIQREARRKAQPLVTPAEVEAWEKYKAYALPILLALVRALIEARITPREFERLMFDQIRRAHTVAYAIARGGLSALTPTDTARIEARVNGQARFLAAWVAAMALTAPAVVSGGSLLLVGGKATSLLAQSARAGMYLDSAGAELFAGKAVAVGLPELPAYPKDGQTRCLRRCYCGWWIEQVGAADWNCYWMLNWTGIPEIHCEHCPRRALAWSPLQVRGGLVQPHIRWGLFL